MLMNIKKVKFLTFLLTLFSVNLASAENYFGGNLNFVDYEIGAYDTSITVASAKIGTKFHENFSAEFRFGFGLDDDSVDVLGTPVELEIDYLFGAYLKGSVPFTTHARPYVLVGYTKGEAEASADGVSVDDSDSDISFGFGLDYDLLENIILNAEYISWFDKNDTEISGFSIGLASRF